MTITRKASRIARLEQSLGIGADPEFEPFGSSVEFWDSLAVGDAHRSDFNAGLCAYGEGLSPRDQHILLGVDHLYNRHIQLGAWISDASPQQEAAELGRKQ